MRTEIGLRNGLRDEDWVWLFQMGETRVVKPKTAILREGVRPNALFMVIRGQFSVRVQNVVDEPLARLGTGEWIGEISFLEGSSASATIVSELPSAVLVIDTDLLHERIREDAAFAARIYRAFALIAERRLRNRVDRLASRFETGSGSHRRGATRVPAIA